MSSYAPEDGFTIFYTWIMVKWPEENGRTNGQRVIEDIWLLFHFSFCMTLLGDSCGVLENLSNLAGSPDARQTEQVAGFLTFVSSSGGAIDMVEFVAVWIPCLQRSRALSVVHFIMCVFWFSIIIAGTVPAYVLKDMNTNAPNNSTSLTFCCILLVMEIINVSVRGAVFAPLVMNVVFPIIDKVSDFEFAKHTKGLRGKFQILFNKIGNGIVWLGSSIIPCRGGKRFASIRRRREIEGGDVPVERPPGEIPAVERV